MFTEEIKMKPFLTGKLLGTFVVLFMSSQDVAVGKAGIADIAGEGPLAGVSSDVILQLTGLSELLITVCIITLVGSLVPVDRFNVLIQALGDDLFVTNVAGNHRVGYLLAVNHLRVSPVFCSPAKHFITGGTFQTSSRLPAGERGGRWDRGSLFLLFQF